MPAFEQRHPHVAGREALLVFGGERRTRLPTPMPLRLVIGLENTGKRGGATPCGAGIEPLALRHRDLVVDPAMLGIPKPRIAVFGRNVDVGRTDGMLEILQAPGIGFADRHV